MGNSPLALGVERTSTFHGVEARRFLTLGGSTATLPEIQILRGRDALLGKLDLLNLLCERAGQPGATRWLEYQMELPANRNKIPTLVLVGGRRGGAEPITDRIRGAVILYEYTILGCGTRIFSGIDLDGQQNVFAPKELRAEVVQAACNELLSDGAQAAMVPYEGGKGRGKLEFGYKVEMGTRMRSVMLFLPLAATFEATLASLGRHTRRNLRYYRRRAETEMGARFVPEATISRNDFLQLNRASINPTADGLAQWRYDSFAGRPEKLFAGVRSQDGRWLSLIGGRRNERLTEIDWQMNVAGLSRLSLSTVMRSYLLEHEVGRGTEILKFIGGTPHSMRHSFVCVDVVDKIALRRPARMLRMLAPILPQKNFLVQALRDPAVRWNKG